MTGRRSIRVKGFPHEGSAGAHSMGRPSILCVLAAALLTAMGAQDPPGLAAQDERSLSLAPPDASLDERFHRLRAVRELQDGRLLVTEAGQRLLAVIDWSTGSVRTIGRVGDGPLEYRRPYDLFRLTGDSTLMVDAQTRGIFILHGTEIVSQVPRQHPLRQVFYSPHPFGADGRGRVVGPRIHRWDESLGIMGRQSPDSMVVLSVYRRSMETDTVGVIRGPGMLGLCMQGRPAPGQGPVTHIAGGCSPIFVEEHGVQFLDGWLAIARVDPYRVDWRAPDGTWVRGDPLPYTPRPLTGPERCAALHGWSFEGQSPECGSEDFEGVVEWVSFVPPFPPRAGPARARMVAPGVPTLLAAPGGEVLIRRTPTLADRGTRYDLVDREGELVGVLRLPANEAVVGFGRNHVYVIATDPFELQHLRRHPWP